MAAFRALLFFTALSGFFLVGAPAQWLLARYVPWAAHLIPLVFCRTLLAILRVRVDVSGSRAGGAPVLVASNHVSWIDILAFGGLMPFCFLAKSDVAGWPVVSAFAEVQGTVFVDRKRRRSIPPANLGLAKRMLEGRTALLFPEATTIAGPVPGRFHTSHFAAARDLLRLAPEHGHVAVQPAAIAYSAAHAAWIGDDALLPHLWRVLRERPLTCEILFGAPVAVTHDHDRKAVGRATRDGVVALLEGRRRDRREPEAQQRPAPDSLAPGHC